MRKFLFLTLAALAFASCSNDDEGGKDPVEKYTVTVNGGTADPSGEVAVDTKVTLTPSTPEGYGFAEWQSEDVTVDDTDDVFTFIMPDHDVTVTATFEGLPQTLTVIEGTATVNGEPVGETVATGETVVLTYTPKPDFIFDGWESEDVTVDETNGVYSFEMPGHEVTVTASFEPTTGIAPEINNPAAPYIIYFDGERMQLSSWNAVTGGAVTHDNALYFRFGSVVGFAMTVAGDTWSADDVKFDVTAGNYTSYANIPLWNGQVFNDGYISTVDYHNLENVLTGRGDPCKLVGFTVEDIADGAHDNGLYRLPTNNELQFAGYAKTSGTGSAFGIQIGSDNTSFLPALGYRDVNGDSQGWEANGEYLSSRPNNASGAFSMIWNASLAISFLPFNAQIGAAVRCVPVS